MQLNNYHGSAGSPILYKDQIFLFQDHRGTGTTKSFVAAFNKNTGKQVWKTDRVETTGWGTPVVIRAGDRDELIVSSQRKVYAYDPQTGKELWTVGGLTFEVIPTPVVAEGLVICSSGRQGSDDRDPSGRQRRRHGDSRRLDVTERVRRSYLRASSSTASSIS